MQYYWLIVTILFGIKLLKGKELSSYNTKWMLVYVVYLLWLQAECFSDVIWRDEIENYIVVAFLLPLATYLIFPFVWKFLYRWKLFRWIEDKIDKWYNTIKNKS